MTQVTWPLARLWLVNTEPLLSCDWSSALTGLTDSQVYPLISPSARIFRGPGSLEFFTKTVLTWRTAAVGDRQEDRKTQDWKGGRFSVGTNFLDLIVLWAFVQFNSKILALLVLLAQWKAFLHLCDFVSMPKSKTPYYFGSFFSVSYFQVMIWPRIVTMVPNMSVSGHRWGLWCHQLHCK